MKKTILVIAIVLGGLDVFAQPTPPTGGSGHKGAGENGPIGGGAPIDGGFSILMALGAFYGGKKLYDLRKEKQ